MVMFYVVAPYDTGGVTTSQRVMRTPSSAAMSLEVGRDQVEQTESKVK
jgi:hypothetical protein